MKPCNRDEIIAAKKAELLREIEALELRFSVSSKEFYHSGLATKDQFIEIIDRVMR